MYIRTYTGIVQFQWDPAKERANLSKHGIRFADAVSVLEDDRALTIRDPDDESEIRWVTVGIDAMGRVLVVIYTWREESVRIISARRAMAREISQYRGQR